jgi:PAS domain S-box-containing protein
MVLNSTKEVAKYSVIYFICAAILFGVTALHHLTTVRSADEKKIRSHETLNVQLGKTAIQKSFEGIISDLSYLAEYNERNDAFAPENQTALERMKLEFQVFSQQKRQYDQIRYLDITGNEIVRVNYIVGIAEIVPDEKLQNKLIRYYFHDSIKLDKGKIFVSKFDLNIEHGKIEQPVIPTIRFGTPVFDTNGNKRGVLLLNFHGQVLLDDFLTAISNIATHTMLLNADGFWLRSPDSEQEWGFMYDSNETFASTFTEAWGHVEASKSGQLTTTDGLFTFDTVVPHLNKSGGNYWKIVSYIPESELYAATRFNRYLPVYIISFIVISIASVLLAYSQVKHRKAREQIEYEQRFRETLENIDLLAIGLDDGGKITFCNKAILNLCGWDKKEVIGNNWFEQFIPEENCTQEKERFRNIVSKTCKTLSFENEILTCTGEKRLISWNISLAEDDEQQIYGIHCIGENITDLRRDQEELIKVLWAVEQSPSTVIITNINGEIEYVNPKFTELTGYTSEEVLGKNPRLLKSGETDSSEYKNLWDTVTVGGTWHGIFHNRKKNGELYWEATSISPIRNVQGEITHFLAVKEDITERKRLESEVDERNREIARNHALTVTGRMANMIAHDLRNPLSSIKMTLQILSNKNSTDSDEEELELKQIALGQIKYMEEIMEDLLTYSRPDALKPEWLKLDELMNKVLIQVQKEINEHRAIINKQYQSGIPNIYGDARKLRQLLANIIINALQSTESIHDKIAEITIVISQELGADTPRIHVEIIDNGQGIASDNEDKILEPFFTTRAKGTGLGLAIVNRIVDQHQGKLQFRASDQGGTHVTIILPTGLVDYESQPTDPEILEESDIGTAP